MRFAVPLAALVAVALGAPADKVKEKFDKFKKDHGIKCTGVDCGTKYAHFAKQLARLEDLQAKTKKAGKKYSLGMTKFMTWSDEEKRALLNHQPVPVERVPKMKEQTHRKKRQAATVDWRDYGYVAPVRNQEDCGSCWSFTAVACVESQWNSLGNNEEFSEQQLVDCNKANGGCTGGWYDKAFTYMAANGCVHRADYPYVSGTTATEGTCQLVSSSYIVSDNSSVWASTVGAMEEALTYYGPIGIYIYVPTDFYYYTGGVYDPDQSGCTATNNDGMHAMAVIGFGTDDVDGDYWIVRNSWGEDWGESGYARMKKSINNCQIEDYAVLPIVDGQQPVEW